MEKLKLTITIIADRDISEWKAREAHSLALQVARATCDGANILESKTEVVQGDKKSFKPILITGLPTKKSKKKKPTARKSSKRRVTKNKKRRK